MYSLNKSVSEIRTKMREEFERHRYVDKLPVVDMLIFQSHAEYQVRVRNSFYGERPGPCKSAWNEENFRLQRRCRGLNADSIGTGNSQLLETITTRAQVLPKGRKPYSDTATEFHAGFPRGQSQIHARRKVILKSRKGKELRSDFHLGGRSKASRICT
jgi:hypothetical protein